MPAVTYTPAMRVINADYTIAGRTAAQGGMSYIANLGFAGFSQEFGVWLCVHCVWLFSGR